MCSWSLHCRLSLFCTWIKSCLNRTLDQKRGFRAGCQSSITFNQSECRNSTLCQSPITFNQSKCRNSALCHLPSSFSQSVANLRENPKGCQHWFPHKPNHGRGVKNSGLRINLQNKQRRADEWYRLQTKMVMKQTTGVWMLESGSNRSCVSTIHHSATRWSDQKLVREEARFRAQCGVPYSCSFNCWLKTGSQRWGQSQRTLPPLF